MVERAAGDAKPLQLSRHIGEAIKAGTLVGESPLPFKREMASLSGLSRVTICKATEVLVLEQLVTPRHGSGNFVSPPVNKLDHSLSRITSFTEDMRRRGKSSSTERSALPLDILPNPEAVNTSLYNVLAERGLRPLRAMQRISAARLAKEQAQRLEIDVHNPALKIARTGQLASGRIIELTTGIYRGDAYDFVAELQL